VWLSLFSLGMDDQHDGLTNDGKHCNDILDSRMDNIGRGGPPLKQRSPALADVSSQVLCCWSECRGRHRDTHK